MYAGNAAEAITEAPWFAAMAPAATVIGSAATTALREAGAPEWLAVAGGIAGALTGQGGIAMAKNWLHGERLGKELTAAEEAARAAKANLLTAQLENPATADARKIALEAVQDSQKALAAKAIAAADAQFNTNSAAIARIRDEAQTLARSQITGTADVIAPLPAGITRQLPEATGVELQEAARNWLGKVLPSKVSAVWQPVDAALPPDTPVQLSGLIGALGGINNQAGVLAPLAKMLKSRLPAQMGKTLDDMLESPGMVAGTPAKREASGLLDDIGLPVLKETAPAVPAKPITMADAQALRTAIGDAMADPTVLRDISAQNLSRLYASLTADMRAPHVKNGTAALFDSANTESVRLYQLAEGPFARLVASATRTADDMTPGKVVNRLLTDAKVDGSDLAALRGEIPGAVDRLAGLQLRTDPTGWSKLTEQAKAALVSDPSHRRVITSALDAEDVAGNTAKTVIDQLREARAAAVATVRATRDAEIRAASRANARESVAERTSLVRLRQASGEADLAANAAAAAAAGHPTNWKAMLGMGTAGGLAGPGLVDMLYPQLLAGALPNRAQMTGAILGAAAVPAYYGAKAVVKNPLMLIPPVAAGNAANIARRNELAPAP